MAWFVGLFCAAMLLQWLPRGWYQSIIFGALVGLLVGAAQSRHLGAFVKARTWITHNVVSIAAVFGIAMSISFGAEVGFVSAVLIGVCGGAAIGFGQVTAILTHVHGIGPWLQACAAAFGVTAALVSISASVFDPRMSFALLGAIAFGSAQAWLFRRLTAVAAH